MSLDQLVFVLVAYRYGEENSHSYLRGVFSVLERAESDAHDHVRKRAGKYSVVIYAAELNGQAKPIYTYRGLGFFDRVTGGLTEANKKKAKTIGFNTSRLD